MRSKKPLHIIILIGLLGLLNTLQAGSVSGGVNVWASIGPGGGRVSVLAVDPLTPATLYAGTGGGVYKSKDGGGSLRAFNTGLAVRFVGALAIEAGMPVRLYAGTFGGGVFAAQPVDGIFPLYLPFSVYPGE